jgi:hypothetical protein
MQLSKHAVLIAFLTLAASHSTAAQSTTAFKKGEQTTGMTKQCYYDALGSGYTITVSSIDLCPLTIQVAAPMAPKTNTPAYPTIERQPSTTGFKKGELTTGMTKQCFYDALGSTYTKTMNSIDLCPLTIQIPNR